MTQDGTYHLDQTLLLQILQKQWGSKQACELTQDNDKLRLYGLPFHENNIDKLYRLASGVTKREHIDDPQQSPRGVYTMLSLDFNNQDIKVELPEGADDVGYASDLNPNDSM